MTDDTQRRLTFDQEAQLYNEIRPRYPEALFETMIDVTALSPRAKLVEIGPGTGQATRPLARRGYQITAIELGAALADVARHQLRLYPNVRVVTGAFEEIAIPADTFDLVFAATAFHWIRPELRYVKPHHILKATGHLAIIHTHHVSDERGDQFFKATQPIYERYFANATGKPPALPGPDTVKPTELDEKLFKLAHFQRFPMVVAYTAQEYAKLLNTYSPTLVLPEQKRTAFLNDIEALINDRFHGRVNKHFVMSLTVAHKQPCEKSDFLSPPYVSHSGAEV
jgi:SAM-dependent methyltransferase